ncbi:PRC-barrel domain-containing protein [Acetobacter aceti]|uniref:PRC-barrel domain-containing protein n=1 Tax=Acetobacter aceti TaxID=435 RepID=UPI00022605F1|nr:PRC-barrel domain-containing protein [Acetobacter aceti]
MSQDQSFPRPSFKINGLESDVMDGFGSCGPRLRGALLTASLGCAVASFMVVVSPGALAQSQPAHSISENRDTVTGDNPDLDIPEAPPAKPASDSPQPAVIAAIITTESLGSLIDRDVQAVTGGNLGHIVDVLIDVDGEMQAVVIDIGGFLGVGNRRVAVASDLIQVSHSNPQAPVIMQVSAAVIRSAPEYKRGDRNASVLTGPRLLASGQPAGASTSSSTETISVKPATNPDPSPPASSSGG